jgi:hypothetical protein
MMEENNNAPDDTTIDTNESKQKTDDTKAAPSTDNPVAVSIPLNENIHVQQLYAILNENKRDTALIDALIDCVVNLEKILDASETQIANMRSQISDMKEIQDHPIQHALQNTVKGIEQDVKEAKGLLESIKDGIIQGCKNAVQAVKDTGIKALDSLVSFFKIKAPFQAIEKSANKSIDRCDKAINKIESFAQEYHKVGMGLKNMARILVGKEKIDTPKEAGKLAAVIASPYKLAKEIATENRDTAREAISAIEEIEERSDNIRVDSAQQKSDKADRGNNEQKKEAMTDRLENAKQRAQERNAERKSKQPEQSQNHDKKSKDDLSGRG